VTLRVLTLTLLSTIALGVPALAEDRSVVHILLTTSPAVKPAARMAMMREATGIWARAGIRLNWVDPTARPQGLSLRVLTVEHTGPAGMVDTAVLGELVRGAGTTAAAMIAFDRAATIATRGSLNRGSLSVDQRLGLVLGRAVAHEIGHFLLAGLPHQHEGLMRARFPENELTDAWSTQFELTTPLKAVALATLAKGLPARVPAISVPAASAGRSAVAD
jgi:hypothetical protein